MSTEEDTNSILPHARSIIKLLQGVIYREDENDWQEVLKAKIPIHLFLRQIGLELVVDEQEGFAYVNQPESTKDSDISLPRLMRIRPLKYEHVQLCVLLREWLDEFDKKTSEGTRLFITKGQIKEQIEIFFHDQTNRTRLYKELNAAIEYVRTNLSVLRRMTSEDDPEPDRTRYEVRRIIKAMLTAEKLEEIKEKLTQHIGDVEQ